MTYKKLILPITIFLLYITTLPLASALYLINVTDDKESISPDKNVNFTAYWTDSGGDNVKLLIADNTGFTNCDYNTNTGCMCSSPPTTANTSSCQYTVKKTDPENFIWYGRACNSSNSCTPVIREHNYTGVINPGSDLPGTRAFAGSDTNLPPTSMLLGSQISTGNYSNIASSDNVRFHHTIGYVDGFYELVRFRYLINVSANSINFMKVRHEGYGRTQECDSGGLFMYIWNMTGAWELVDGHTAYESDALLEKYMYHGFNFSKYINESDGYLNVLVITRDTTLSFDPECPYGSIYTDQALVNLIIGGSFVVSGKNFQLSLEINNTDATVYIPGVGEVASSSLDGRTYTNQTHNYLASYIGNALTGLVASVGNYLFVSNTTNTHTLKISQNLTPQNKVFLVFTRGDWSDIDNRMGLVEAGEFLFRITPTFGFGLGVLYPMKLLLNYTDIDIRGNLILRKGMHKIIIDYNETTSDNRPVLYII